MDPNTIHYLTKGAFKGDIGKAKTVLRYLEKYRISATNISSYLIVFQIAMNLLDISEECRLCGGKCCKEGGYIPVYRFDVEDITRVLGDGMLKHFVKINGSYYLPRPCPFLKDWMCSINTVKPYACLSYPFASEEVQIDILTRGASHGYPQPIIPYWCRAGFKAWKMIMQVIDKLSTEKGRTLKPIELLEALYDLLSKL
ncbi:MAG: YkgJ family cysteine cluster protein [Ignisphaera sp.]|nr:YkgJ family cysteine cluster protein [Ignisphaera sp.]MCX8168520.1 YkgJ family cysteine cluster protein [Ignisphaera sp.]MDW8085041.1 YkgJ family cysteine cluster protein [Ignisphaera sp.]